MKQFVTISLLALILIGCKEYTYTNRSRKITKGDYTTKDTIYVKDFILCNGLRKFTDKRWHKNPYGERIPINADSVMVHFKEALDKLPVPVLFLPEGQNHCDSVFHRNVYAKDKRIDRDKIKEIANESSKKLVIVPYVYIDNTYDYNVMPASGGAHVGELQKFSFLKILIYVFNDGEIVYFRSARHRVKSSHESMDEEPDRQTQENWDRLVKFIMWDYLKRAK